ncbi:MAG TPA: efflux RND transporter periplasmic adaptor subunit [Tepidisphaeraceae bacterium]|jgi:multidrug efflux pump subunit AcrA (membrane-fusion protein)
MATTAITLQADPSERAADAPHEASAPPAPARTRTILVIAGCLIAVFITVLVLGLVERHRNSSALATVTSAAASAPPEVYVVHPAPAATANSLLPANIQAMQDAIVYARVSGYLSKRYVDLGDHVKTGELLAEIASPELDQQLSQARANLQQAGRQLDLQKANRELARTTMVRYQGADKEGAVAKEALDQAVSAFQTAEAAVAAAQATVDANQATVRQYEAMTAFDRVLAPFDGVITQRNVDVGALITAGSPVNNISAAPTSVAGAATGLFEVSQVDTLRVFVSVPQVFAANVKPGLAAQVMVRGGLESPVTATVARTADALDPATRTLLTEVDVPNKSHMLFPGEFVYVTFKVPPAGTRWNIPATALIFNSDGTQVMLVGPDNKLHLRQVTVGRDFGDTIDIQAGLSGADTVVEQPDVSLQNGQLVTPIESQHATPH